MRQRMIRDGGRLGEWVGGGGRFGGRGHRTGTHGTASCEPKIRKVTEIKYTGSKERYNETADEVVCSEVMPWDGMGCDEIQKRTFEQ